MRCLTLAEALRERGAVCAFAVNEAGASLIARFSGGGFALHRGSVSQALAANPYNVLVLDDYALAASDERPLSHATQKLVVIDDLADRPHVADLLIDPGYGRLASDYEGLTSDACRLIIGPAYALVKPAFRHQRAAALARSVSPLPQRLFVSFGLSDIGGIADQAVALIRARMPSVQIDLALASDAQSGAALMKRAKADPALRLHFDATNIADLMASADLAVGAGGASTWERACLGLPTLAVIVAANQRAMIKALARNGVLLAVDMADADLDGVFDTALSRLCDPVLRGDMRLAAASLCDGLGADRVAEAILAL